MAALRRTSRLAGIWLVCIACYAMPAISQVTQTSLSKEEVVALLKGGVTSKRIASIVRERGIEFAMTPAIENELRSDGATNELIDMLRDLRRSATKSSLSKDSAPSKSPPEVASPKSQGAGASARRDNPDFSGMSLMEKVRYAKSLVQQGQFDEALKVYAIIAREAPEPILYQDDLAEAKRLKSEKEERHR